MLPKGTLKDRVAIITGGGIGLGHGDYLGALERLTSERSRP